MAKLTNLKFMENNHKTGMFSELNEKTFDKFSDSNLKNVFFSIPSSLFYLRSDISAFGIKQGVAPLNPYMNFDYNIFNTVAKKTVRIANNNLISKADELWVFSENFNSLTDGVLAEIKIAKENKKKIKYFKIPEFKETSQNISNFEGIENYYGIKLKGVERKTCYTAMSSKLFYFRSFISKNVLEKNYIPINPFMSFDYFLIDKIPRDSVLFANSNFVEMSDELWVFGKISDGVFAEIKLAKKLGKPIKYFKVEKPDKIVPVKNEDVEMENNLKHLREEL